MASLSNSETPERRECYVNLATDISTPSNGLKITGVSTIEKVLFAESAGNSFLVIAEPARERSDPMGTTYGMI